MRPLRITAIALIASAGLVVAGCGGDEDPAADEATTAASTPSEEDTATPDDEATEEGDTGEAGEVDDFPDVDGFTLVKLPGQLTDGYEAALEGQTDITGIAGRSVESNGKPAGIVLRMGLNPDSASNQAFTDDVLPQLASMMTGTGVTPDTTEINGVNVLVIEQPGTPGAAYAWVEDSVMTMAILNDAADAKKYAEGALD